MAVVIFVGRRLVSYRGVAGGAPVAVGWHGERVEFEQAQLVALGREGWYGDAVVRVLGRLSNGEVVQIMGAEQSPEGQRWLRARLRKWKAMPCPTRESGFSRAWEDDLAGRPAEPPEEGR